MEVHIDPILIQFGPFRISWYGLMYVIGFIASYLLVRFQLKKRDFGITRGEVEDLYFYLIIGLFVGARLGYVLFYDFTRYLDQPLEIIAVWHGGMSFHGGLIGVIGASLLFCRKKHKSFWKLADLFVVTAPIGLGLGRIGNFINGELYGRISQVPWAMVFPAGGSLPRHPSQLYESAVEGGVLFAILWHLKDRNLPPGSLLVIFLILYGIFRFFLEFFRQPDPQLGFVWGPLTLGQIFCLLMIAGGVILALIVKKKNKK
jgi:phosphatidylglycerol:prolipoprotein diacylglycerol transferase